MILKRFNTKKDIAHINLLSGAFLEKGINEHKNFISGFIKVL